MTDQQTYNYKVVRQFAIMTIVWGIVGMLVGVLIAAQPTRGVDIGAIEYIHSQLLEQRAEGLCDR